MIDALLQLYNEQFAPTLKHKETRLQELLSRQRCDASEPEEAPLVNR